MLLLVLVGAAGVVGAAGAAGDTGADLGPGASGAADGTLLSTGWTVRMYTFLFN